MININNITLYCSFRPEIKENRHIKLIEDLENKIQSHEKAYIFIKRPDFNNQLINICNDYLRKNRILGNKISHMIADNQTCLLEIFVTWNNTSYIVLINPQMGVSGEIIQIDIFDIMNIEELLAFEIWIDKYLTSFYYVCIPTVYTILD